MRYQDDQSSSEYGRPPEPEQLARLLMAARAAQRGTLGAGPGQPSPTVPAVYGLRPGVGLGPSVDPQLLAQLVITTRESDQRSQPAGVVLPASQQGPQLARTALQPAQPPGAFVLAPTFPFAAGAGPNTSAAPPDPDPAKALAIQSLRRAQPQRRMGAESPSTANFPTGQNQERMLLAQAQRQQQRPEQRLNWSAPPDDKDKDKKLPKPDAQHNHTITVRYVEGQGGNTFGHVTVQVDGGKEIGYAPKKDMTTTEILKNKSVPGQVEPRATGVKTLDQVTINVTADQAKAAQKVIDDRTGNPGNYAPMNNNCTQFGAAVVNAAGGDAPIFIKPSDLIRGLRQQQYDSNSTQPQPRKKDGSPN